MSRVIVLVRVSFATRKHHDQSNLGRNGLIKIHFHTNEPWKVLEYCASLGEIHDIVIEDMDRQSRGLKG